MIPPMPPILDYRTRRHDTPARDWRRACGEAYLLVVAPCLVFLGSFYVFVAVFDYCTSAKPFSREAFVVSLIVLAASVGFGFTLRAIR
jgi:hypothetical protein